jgi:hypothetical protein
MTWQNAFQIARSSSIQMQDMVEFSVSSRFRKAITHFLGEINFNPVMYEMG